MTGSVFWEISQLGRNAHGAAQRAHQVLPHTHKAGPHMQSAVPEIFSLRQVQIPIWTEKRRSFIAMFRHGGTKILELSDFKRKLR
jgi:hypothetical protein